MALECGYTGSFRKKLEKDFLFVISFSQTVHHTKPPPPSKKLMDYPYSMYYAALRGDWSSVRAGLQAGFPINQALIDGAFILHTAVWKMNLPMVSFALEVGADPNLMDRTFCNAGHYAVLVAEEAILEKLLRAGCDVNVMGGKIRKRSMLQMAVSTAYELTSYGALQCLLHHAPLEVTMVYGACPRAASMIAEEMAARTRWCSNRAAWVAAVMRFSLYQA